MTSGIRGAVTPKMPLRCSRYNDRIHWTRFLVSSGLFALTTGCPSSVFTSLGSGGEVLGELRLGVLVALELGGDFLPRRADFLLVDGVALEAVVLSGKRLRGGGVDGQGPARHHQRECRKRKSRTRGGRTNDQEFGSCLSREWEKQEMLRRHCADGTRRETILSRRRLCDANHLGNTSLADPWETISPKIAEPIDIVKCPRITSTTHCGREDYATLADATCRISARQILIASHSQLHARLNAQSLMENVRNVGLDKLELRTWRESRSYLSDRIQLTRLLILSGSRVLTTGWLSSCPSSNLALRPVVTCL